MNRFPVLAAIFAAFVVAGCSCGGGGTDGGTDAATTCRTAADCPDPNFFFCDTKETFTCKPSCSVDNDCSDSARGQYAIAGCGEGLGCKCDTPVCVKALCSSDSECGAQVCRNGSCVAPPAATTAATCQITPDFAVLRGGQKTKFWVSAWGADKAPIVFATGVSWTATNAAVTTTGGTGNSAEFTAGSTTGVVSAVDAVQATIGTANCTAKILVLPEIVPVGKIDVVVTDELTGRPIQGATVLASNPTTGVSLGATVTSNANGFAELTAVTPASVTVFHADYSYLTVANYSGSDRFLSMVVRRNPVDKYGGYKAKPGFSNVPVSPDVHVGLVGASLPGAFTDLSFTQLLGPTAPRTIKIGDTFEQADVPLPAGVFLVWTDKPPAIKDDVSGLGLAGVCLNSAGQPDEAQIAAGSCGTRSAWGLSGDVAVKDLPLSDITGDFENLNYGSLLSKLIPLFAKFSSSVGRDVQFTLQDTPEVSGDKVFDDVSNFTTFQHNYTQMPLGFNFAVKHPDLPKFANAYVDGLIVLGGALVPGRGVVPMGIGAGFNGDANAKTDPQVAPAPPLAAGLVTMRMAPAHHGLEGSDYGAMLLAVSLKGATDASSYLATSGIFARFPNNKIPFDPKGATPLDVQGPFLNFPENAKYNFTSAPQGALTARTFKFTADPGLTGATVIRVVFTDTDEHRWSVFMDPAQALSGFVLPNPPGSFDDRTYALGNTGAGARSLMVVQTLNLKEDPKVSTSASIGFNKLVEFNSTNADRLHDFMATFALIDYAKPLITFETPAKSNDIVAPGSALKVKVQHFKVGSSSTDDGYVRFTFSNTATCPAVDVKTDASGGKGEITGNIPAGCTGTQTVTATLFDNANVAISPPVTRDTVARIQ